MPTNLFVTGKIQPRSQGFCGKICFHDLRPQRNNNQETLHSYLAQVQTSIITDNSTKDPPVKHGGTLSSFSSYHGINKNIPKLLILLCYLPSGQNRQKAVCRSVFVTIWHYIFSAELTKTHSTVFFFGNFALWVNGDKSNLNNRFFCSLQYFLWITLLIPWRIIS